MNDRKFELYENAAKGITAGITLMRDTIIRVLYCIFYKIYYITMLYKGVITINR